MSNTMIPKIEGGGGISHFPAQTERFRFTVAVAAQLLFCGKLPAHFFGSSVTCAVTARSFAIPPRSTGPIMVSRR